MFCPVLPSYLDPCHLDHYFLSLYTDVVLFFFLFFSKKSTSIDPLKLVVNKSPAVFILYHARSTDFEEKIEGL